MKKNKAILICPFILMAFLLIIAYGCMKKDDNPINTMTTVTDVD